MKKLFDQIIKFGVVGVIAFIIDFSVTMVLSIFLRGRFALIEPGTPASVLLTPHSALYIASFCGFVVSLIFNYIASMTFVFKRREGVSRTREAAIFTILSLIGLGIHEVILYICVNGITAAVPEMATFMDGNLMNGFSKIMATGVVMVYNFISRKILLEDRGDTAGDGGESDTKTDGKEDLNGERQELQA